MDQLYERMSSCKHFSIIWAPQPQRSPVLRKAFQVRHFSTQREEAQRHKFPIQHTNEAVSLVFGSLEELRDISISISSVSRFHFRFQDITSRVSALPSVFPNRHLSIPLLEMDKRNAPDPKRLREHPREIKVDFSSERTIVLFFRKVESKRSESEMKWNER